ncbi:UNKNOWN [Stylonychia lemnae]|uniref:Uncharacterized protein n=1 Tax=Stylonychia lemnae TaxID=5949 RepID=A0A077ZNS6_STYLE|nr:UNKNOWN [Stylonychia lemnae]|eukprot:CDW71124.1 UNKNOWN [Stylonychia lemnae]
MCCSEHNDLSLVNLKDITTQQPLFLNFYGCYCFETQWFGYILVWANNFSQSFYNIYMNKAKRQYNLTPLGKFFFQILPELNLFFSIVSIPILGGLAMYRDEIKLITIPLATFDSERIIGFYVYISLSGLLGICLTLFVTLAYQVCDPMTVNVVGVFKDVLLSQPKTKTI